MKSSMSNDSRPGDLPAVIARARQHARHNGLIYVSDTDPGIQRVRVGKGFRYLGPPQTHYWNPHARAHT